MENTYVYCYIYAVTGLHNLYCIDWTRPWLRFWEFILYFYFFIIFVSHLYLYLHFINWKRPWPWVWEFPSDWFLQWSWTKAAAEGRASLVKITLPCSYRWYSLNDIFLSFFYWFENDITLSPSIPIMILNAPFVFVFVILHLYLYLYSTMLWSFFNQFVKTKIKLHLWKSSNQPPCWFTTQFGDGIAVPVFSLCRRMTL